MYIQPKAFSKYNVYYEYNNNLEKLPVFKQAYNLKIDFSRMPVDSYNITKILYQDQLNTYSSSDLLKMYLDKKITLEEFSYNMKNNTIPDHEYYHNIYHLKNIKFVNNNLFDDYDPEYIKTHLQKKYNKSGNYFIVWLGQKNIFHLLVDVLGQFLYLKEMIPDLKAIPMYYSVDGDPSGDLGIKPVPERATNWDRGDMMPAAIELARILDINIEEAIDSFSLKELSIENLFFCTTTSDSFLSVMLGEESQNGIHFSLKDHLNTIRQKHHYTAVCVQKIKQIVDLEYLDDNNSYPEKIFLAVPPNKFPLNMDNAIEKEPHLASYLSIDEYNVVLDFAKNNNFTIIEPWNISFREQVLYSRNAKIIITVGGSNAIHSLWSKNDTRFFYFNPHQFHYEPFEYIMEMYGKDNDIIFKNSAGKQENFDKVFKELQKSVNIAIDNLESKVYN